MPNGERQPQPLLKNARLAIEDFGRRKSVSHREFLPIPYVVYTSDRFPYQYLVGTNIAEVPRKAGGIGYVTVTVWHPLVNSYENVLLIGCDLDSKGNLIGVAGKKFYAYYRPEDELYRRSGAMHILRYEVDGTNVVAARLNGVYTYTDDQLKRLGERKIETLYLDRWGFPSKTAWLETYMTYATGKQIAVGELPEEYNRVVFQHRPDLTADRIHDQLLLPFS